jgi:hypothetical protein
MEITNLREIYLFIAKSSSFLNIIPLVFLYLKGFQRRGLLLHLTWLYASTIILHSLYYLFVDLKDGRPYYTVQHLHIYRNIIFFYFIFNSFIGNSKVFKTKVLIIILLLELINILFGEGLNNAKWALLLMNFYIVIVCGLGIYHYSNNLTIGKPNRKSYFIILTSFLIAFATTTISELLIPYLWDSSKSYYYWAFIFGNVVSIILEIVFICFAIYIFTPTATPKPSQQPLEPN